MLSFDMSKLLKPEVFIILFFAVLLTIIAIWIWFLYKQVTNHLPTQIKEVKTEIKDLSNKVDNNHNKINQRFDKLHQILLDKK